MAIPTRPGPRTGGARTCWARSSPACVTTCSPA